MNLKKISLALLTICLAGVLVLATLMPKEMLKVNNKAPTETPKDYQLAFEDIYFQPQDEAIKLHSWWIPAANPKAIIIMVHGANGSKEGGFNGSLALYKDLNALGYSLLAPDLRNHGTSGRSQSGRLAMGVSEQQDIIASLDFIETNNPSNLPVFAFGLSMGGATVIHAADKDSRIQGLALFDSMHDFKLTMESGIATPSGLPAIIAQPVIWGAKQFYQLSPINAYDIAVKLPQPILLLQDIDDPVTQSQYAKHLQQAHPNLKYVEFKNPQADDPVYLRSPGWGTHVAAYLLEPKVFVTALDSFFKQQIKSIGQPNS